MATEIVHVINFEKALEFFESAFIYLAQKEPSHTSIELLKISLERLAFTAAQIEETSKLLLDQIEDIRGTAQAFSVPVARDTQKEVEESEDDTEALASGDIEITGQANRWWKAVEEANIIEKDWFCAKPEHAHLPRHAPDSNIEKRETIREKAIAERNAKKAAEALQEQTGDLEEFAKRGPYWQEEQEARKTSVQEELEAYKEIFQGLDKSQLEAAAELGLFPKTEAQKAADDQTDLPQATHPSEETQSAPAPDATETKWRSSDARRARRGEVDSG